MASAHGRAIRRRRAEVGQGGGRRGDRARGFAFEVERTLGAVGAVGALARAQGIDAQRRVTGCRVVESRVRGAA
jgi:hypothetical protein